MFQAVPETFWTLLHDKAHWEFELFLMALFDGVIGAGIVGFMWPRIKKHWKHHLERDKREEKVAAAPARQSRDYPWTLETMRIINDLTPNIKGKAFDPGWFLLRQRLEAFEDSTRVSIKEQELQETLQVPSKSVRLPRKLGDENF